MRWSSDVCRGAESGLHFCIQLYNLDVCRSTFNRYNHGALRSKPEDSMWLRERRQTVICVRMPDVCALHDESAAG